MSTDQNHPIIIVENLSFAYQSKNWILQNVSFSINSGTIIGIIGSSGSGKTTLGYILKGIIPHSIRGQLQGNVEIGGLNLRKTTITKLAHVVGMVFQDLTAQIFCSTVKEEIEFGLRNLHLNLDWATEAMDLLGIKDLENQNPLNLSAGQKQRVILASIIALHPKILILDEPTSHLDGTSKEHLRSWLNQLNQEYQTTIILIEQDPWLVGELCQHLFFIQDSKMNSINKSAILEKTLQWNWKK